MTAYQASFLPLSAVALYDRGTEVQTGFLVEGSVILLAQCRYQVRCDGLQRQVSVAIARCNYTADTRRDRQVLLQQA